VKLLFILDPLDSLKAYKDTSVAMMRAAQARGHELDWTEQGSLYWRERVRARTQPLRVKDGDRDWYETRADFAERALADYDAVLMRKDPPFDMEYLTGVWLLSQAEREGARVINNPAAVRDHNEKLGILEFPQFIPPTLCASEPERLHAFIDEQQDVILKRLDGMGGESIFRVRADDANRNVIIETMAQGGTRVIMAQRYLPEIRDGDKRVLLIDGEPVPHVLARMAKPGESRANLAAGGTGVAKPLSKRDREIAAALGPVLAQRGLLLVGMDVIGEHVTEVNVTSPTCFREIQDQTGFDVSGMFLDAVERKIKAKKARTA
jgi:glutathione synthase